MKLNSLLFLCFAVLSMGCSKNDDDDSSSNNNGGGGGGTITIDSPWQYSIKVDGTVFANIENGTTIQGVFDNSGSLAGWPDTSTMNYGSSLYNPVTSASYIDVEHNGHFFPGGQAADSVFLQFFSPGNHPYAPEDFTGFSIRWIDGNGDQWGTDLGSADQTGSSFIIDEVKEVTPSSDYTIKVLAHFNCKLYNGGGQSKTLTEGKYVGKFSNF